jgi:hypothetical protein
VKPREALVDGGEAPPRVRQLDINPIFGFDFRKALAFLRGILGGFWHATARRMNALLRRGGRPYRVLALVDEVVR